MRDISEVPFDGRDLQVVDTVVPKAVNIASVQIGSLEYAPTFGVDFDYFLNSEFKFQNESFRSHLIQKLAEWGVNATEIISTVEALYQQYSIAVQENDPQTEKGGLIV